MKSQNILVCNWKDINHPDAGGAELVTHELLVRMVEGGHNVTLLTAQYKNASMYDTIDGISIIRVKGGRITHSFKALWYYITQLRGKADIVIEEVNTAPYFISFFTKSEKTFLFYHQLAREIWYYQFSKAFAWLGYFFLEPISLLLQALITRLRGIDTITISQSSKEDLIRFGFNPSNIHIISEGLENDPIDLYTPDSKEESFTVLFHSSLRPMKRPEEVIKAVGIFAQKNPEKPITLWISGGGDQMELKAISQEYSISQNVIFYGRTSDNEKFDLMRRASVLCATSIKEGWGLIVSEANSMATPAIVYDVDGLRDSAKHGGGIVCAPNPEALAKELEDMYEVFIHNRGQYDELCEYTLGKSRSITFSQSYSDLCSIIF